MIQKRFLALLLAAAMIWGCEENEEENTVIGEPLVIGNIYGLFITNEGSFGNGNGSIGYYDLNRNRVLQDMFYSANLRPLGDVVQSLIRIDDKVFIVVNNSQKVEVVRADNLESLDIINGFSSPRYLVRAAPAKFYVSDWGGNSIRVVTGSPYAVTGIIPTGSGPEQMIKSGNKVYVANSGGFGDDSTLTVIDASADTVLKTIPVGYNPNSLVLDKDGKLWVLCGGDTGPDFTGGTADDLPGSLYRIDPATDMVEAMFPMGMADHPLKLAINDVGDRLYYLMGSSGYEGMVYRHGISDPALPGAPLVSRNFYGLGVDPDKEWIYGGHVPSFTQAGYVMRYESNGTLIDSARTGIAPNGFVFNY